jgi:hypothetical protein
VTFVSGGTPRRACTGPAGSSGTVSRSLGALDTGATVNLPITLRRYWDLSTTAVFVGSVEVRVAFAGTTFGGIPTLWHYASSGWTDITVRHDAAHQEICGVTSSLSILRARPD